jgi:hypothetical protein
MYKVRMKPRELLGVIIRAFGLFIACYGILQLLSMVSWLAGRQGSGAMPPVVGAILVIAFGLLLVRSARIIVSFAYRDEDSDQ